MLFFAHTHTSVPANVCLYFALWGLSTIGRGTLLVCMWRVAKMYYKMYDSLILLKRDLALHLYCDKAVRANRQCLSANRQCRVTLP